jgi:hypothetical protein
MDLFIIKSLLEEDNGLVLLERAFLPKSDGAGVMLFCNAMKRILLGNAIDCISVKTEQCKRLKDNTTRAQLLQRCLQHIKENNLWSHHL